MLNSEIMIFTDSLSRGGTERHLAMVAPKLASQAFIVDFFVKRRGPLAQDIIDDGVQIRYPWRELPRCSSILLN